MLNFLTLKISITFFNDFKTNPLITTEHQKMASNFPKTTSKGPFFCLMSKKASVQCLSSLQVLEEVPHSRAYLPV